MSWRARSLALVALGAGCSLDLDRLRDSRDGQVLDAADDLDARDLDASGVDALDLDAPSADAAIDASRLDAPSIDARVECVPACESGFRCDDGACVPAFRLGVLYTGAMADRCAAGRDATLAVLACASSMETVAYPLSMEGCSATVGSPIAAVHGGGSALAVADLDRDGAVDVLSVGSSNLAFSFGTPGGFNLASGGSTGHGAGAPSAIAAGDLYVDAGELMDVVIFEAGPRSQWFRHDPSRTLAPRTGAPSGSGITTRDGLVAPMSGDAIADIVRLVALDATGDVSLSVTPSLGDGTFGGASSVRVGRADHIAFFPPSMGSGPAIVATGPSDLYFVEAGSPPVAHPFPLSSSDLLDVVIADLDGALPPEVVVADANGDRVRAFRVTAGSVREVQSVVVGAFGPTADLAAVDIDDDGSSELVLITGGALSIVGVLAPTCP
ncbi:MAG: hypothetical protein J0L92_06905 [Deltaproteobacteria bacterium]|nr:hypothetical protein [Deltaproteobacteria bacterium]